MKRPVLIHVILLCLALVAAYFVWTREPSSTIDEIKILNLRANLDKVVYSTADRVVEATYRKDKAGAYYWVKVETVKDAPKPAPKPSPPKPKTPGADGGVADGGGAKADGGGAKADAKAKADAAVKPPPKVAAPSVKVREVKSFKGNEDLEKLVKGLANLTAIRSIGVLDKEKLALFELSESKKTLTLVVGSTPRVFIIGGATYGNSDTYIQDRQDKRVYVIRQRQIQDFQYAEFRLMDRRPHDFEAADVDRIELVAKEGNKTLLQKNRRHAATAHWVDAAEPDKQKTFYRNWMGKLNRLQAQEYVPPGQTITSLKQLLAATYYLGSNSRGFLKLYKGQAMNSKKGPTPVLETNFYIETEHTRGKVQINKRLGDELARDIGNLIKE